MHQREMPDPPKPNQPCEVLTQWVVYLKVVANLQYWEALLADSIEKELDFVGEEKAIGAQITSIQVTYN